MQPRRRAEARDWHLEGPSPVEGWVCGGSWVTRRHQCQQHGVALLSSTGRKYGKSLDSFAVLGVTGLLWVRGDEGLASELSLVPRQVTESSLSGSGIPHTSLPRKGVAVA